jgi:hypothetical protein
MKKVPCSCPTCGDRRSNYENPEKPIIIEVPDDFQGFAYCSFECKAYHEFEMKQKVKDDHGS